jgi:hypothetical protein
MNGLHSLAGAVRDATRGTRATEYGPIPVNPREVALLVVEF